MGEKNCADVSAEGGVERGKYETGNSAFSKIKQASIKLDGITVIAGENNTGKSTVGKILSCMFNSMYKVDEKASQKKKEQIESLLRYNWQNSWYHNLKMMIRE